MTEPAAGTVLHVILSSGIAGTERHVAELSCALRLRGWRPLITLRGDADADLAALYRSVAEVRTLPALPYPALVPRLARLARRERVNLLHGHLGNGTFAAVGAGALTGLPVVSTAHFVEYRHMQRLAAPLQHTVYRGLMTRVAAVVAISEAVEDSTRHMYASGRPPVIRVRHGIGCVPATPVGAMPDGEAGIVLFAGRLAPEKQVGTLVRAMSEVRVPGRLWLAGRGAEERELRRLAARLLPDGCRFFGFVPDLAPLMERARLVAVPSRAEPFGLIAIEAMRAARPIVGFAAGALPEIVVDGETGLLVAPDDVGGLARALERLLGDAGEARRMGEAGRRRYLDLFTAARMAVDTERIYRSVLDGVSAAPG